MDKSRGGFEHFRFIIYLVGGRWFTVFASFLVMFGAGATYLFGIYSKQIKATLGYDQTTLNLIGFFKDLGANVGVMSGLIAEVVPTWAVLLIGSAMNFAGYFMIWAAVTGKIPKPRVWHMCAYICIGANSQNFANTGALVTCVKNFPEGRGVMLGLLKGFVGLSGAVMTQMYLAIYGNDSKSLILLIAWLPAAISVVFVYTIRTLEPGRNPNERRIFYRFLYVSIVLALFLMVVTILQKQFVFPKWAYSLCITAVCVLLFVPLMIIVKEELVLWKAKTQLPNVSLPAPRHSNSTTVKVAVEGTNSDQKKSTPWYADIFRPPARGEDYTILQALLSIDMLVLFMATFCGLGSSLTAVDNLGQIGESLGYKARVTSTFLSLVSIWNYFGRVFSGFVSEGLLERYKVPRPLMMTFVLLLSCVGHLLIVFPTPGSLYIASIIIGFSFGAQLPLLFAIISELFGLKYYSTLFNCGQLASPLGSYILNVRVTGKLYDREALKELRRKGLDRSAVKELTCMGSNCYRLSFIILTLVTLFGALVSLVLVARTREFYKGDIYKKFRDEVEVAQNEVNKDDSTVKGQ
ncbi:hypothetical protein SAY86_003117 [Trapa natans]|uniref:Nodulin-like domain-containing protein n=1 Tax=Trapa natans TaxID=22666 RepID=A0AAN7LSL0_TRANT|nr:hypothetical protein SAY86_003117 [Trapa natans]